MRFSFLSSALLTALALLGIPASGADPDEIPPVTAAVATAAPTPASEVAPEPPSAPAATTDGIASGGTGSSARPTPAAPDPYSDVVLRANDRLQFRIAEDPIRAPSPMGLIVNSIGEVGFPISRDSDVRITLQVRGRTLAQVREEITRKLLEDYYHRATVELTMGEKVLTPGKVQFFGEIQTVLPLSPDGPPLKLSDAILQVQAPEFANLRRVKVHRLNAVTGQTTVLEVNVDAIIKDGQRDKDVILEDGDRVEVKQKWFN